MSFLKILEYGAAGVAILALVYILVRTIYKYSREEKSMLESVKESVGEVGVGIVLTVVVILGGIDQYIRVTNPWYMGTL